MIRDIAGHVSREMLKHYSHIRMQAKRTALEGLVTPSAEAAKQDPGNQTSVGVLQEVPKVAVLN